MPFNLQPPALPNAKAVETPADRDQYSNILRLFFNRIVYSLNNVVSGMRPGITESIATSYATTDLDENTLVAISNGGAISVELHTDAPTGCRIWFMQGGAGAITLSAEAGGTVVSAGSLVSSGQYDIMEAWKVTDTQWVVT